MAWFWNRKPSSQELIEQPAAPKSLPASATPPPSSASLISPPARAEVDPSTSGAFSQRSRRQLGLFVGGWVFFALSLGITRRAVARRYRGVRPTYFHDNTRPAPDFNGPLEALEAFYVATLNVASFGMIMTGGTMWAFDIGGLEDLRSRLRKTLYADKADNEAMQKAQVEQEGD